MDRTELEAFAAAMDGDTRRVVMELSTFNDFPIPYIRDFARDIDMTVEKVRRILLALKQVGITGYGPVYSEDGLCTGSTYWLTHLGEQLREIAGSVLA